MSSRKGDEVCDATKMSKASIAGLIKIFLNYKP